MKAPRIIGEAIILLFARSYYISGTYRDKDGVTRTWKSIAHMQLSLGHLLTSKRYRTIIREGLLKKGEPIVTRVIITNVIKMDLLYSLASTLELLSNERKENKR